MKSTAAFATLASLTLTACASASGDDDLMASPSSAAPMHATGLDAAVDAAGRKTEGNVDATPPRRDPVLPDAGTPPADAGLDAAVDAALVADAAQIDGGQVPVDASRGSLRHAIRAVSTGAHSSVASLGMGVGTGDFTFEFWIKPHGAFQASGQVAVAQMNEDYGVNNFTCRLLDNPWIVACSSYDGSRGAPWVFSAPLSNDEWHHFALTRAGGVARIFTDGVAGVSAPNTTPLVALSSLSLGRPAGYSGQCAAPVSLSALRFSKVARYPGSASFSPQYTWPIDTSTIAQLLTDQGITNGVITDEAGGNNNATRTLDWVPEVP